MVGLYLEGKVVVVGLSRNPDEGRRSRSIPIPYDFAIGWASERVNDNNECLEWNKTVMQCVGVWKYVSVDGDGVGNGYPATVEME